MCNAMQRSEKIKWFVQHGCTYPSVTRCLQHCDRTSSWSLLSWSRTSRLFSGSFTSLLSINSLGKKAQELLQTFQISFFQFFPSPSSLWKQNLLLGFRLWSTSGYAFFSSISYLSGNKTRCEDFLLFLIFQKNVFEGRRVGSWPNGRSEASVHK